jgi:hypothetical protein
LVVIDAMCSLCGALMNDDHWAERTDEGAAQGGLRVEDDARRRARRRERTRRVRLVNHILAHHRLVLQDWDGRLYLLRDAKGRSATVPDLGSLWTVAAELSGRRLDPLEPQLLERLTAAGTKP